MKPKTILILLLLSVPGLRELSAADPMSPAYWERWSPEVQAAIDRDIEKNRMADAVIKLPAGIPAGTDIKIEQITHDFIFGANIFNFNQLGTSGRNQKYRDLFGPFFNSATIAFYWKNFEPEPGKLRFAGTYEDSEEFWNKHENPKKHPYWRRPATDPVVGFCESRGIRMHGHPLVWGSMKSNWPTWLWVREKSHFVPESERKKLDATPILELEKTPVKKLEEMAPVFSKNIAGLLEKRISEIAAHYGSRIQSWDVVNESILRRYPVPFPADYTFAGFESAARHFPKDVLLNINEHDKADLYYPGGLKSLLQRGAKIDIMGRQMHIMKFPDIRSIAAGTLKNDIIWPETSHKLLNQLHALGLPIHMSEITIPAPGSASEDFEMQAILVRNLYRLWFSHPAVMGITWWNVVDDCAMINEPTTSGLFTRDMQPKPAYHALNQLINHDWKTNLTIKNPGTGSITFRGFKGNYKITCGDWTTTIHVK